jgi:hypothetical protein
MRGEWRCDGPIGGEGDGTTPLPYRLLWTEPVGDRYLAFYMLNEAPENEPERISIYAGFERWDTGPAVPGGRIERACALASTCLLPKSNFDIGSCVQTWMRASSAARDAFTRATTCDAIAQLVPGTNVACPSDGLVCVGDAVVSCSGGTGTVMESCAAKGGQCASQSGTTRCTYPGVDCASSVTAKCDAMDRAVNCTDGVQDCPASGMTCANGTCVGNDPACATAGVSTVCAGTRSVSCQPDGTSRTILDCGTLGSGFTCDATNVCVGARDCPSNGAPRCDGSRLRYCLFESAREVDCADFGARCDSFSGAARCARDGAVSVSDRGTDSGSMSSCNAPALVGPEVPEQSTATYPMATGGTIADGTYVLTRYEVWSAATTTATHRDIIHVSGARYERTTSHSALGTSSSSGMIVPAGMQVTLQDDCPGASSTTVSYVVNGSSLVLLQSSNILTFTRM